MGSIDTLVNKAVTCAGYEDARADGAHSLCAVFITYAHLRSASGRAIARQVRHCSLATLGTYVRIHQTWIDSAATSRGL